MNTQTEKHLTDIISVLVSSDDLNKEKDFILGKIRMAFLCEQPVCKTPGFDLFKYVSKDKIRPNLMGVYHDGGYKVATDSRLLVAVEEQYDESFEGKILSKTGEFIEWRYPSWRSVLPDVSNHKTIDINLEKVEDIAKRAKARKKAGLALNDALIKVGEVFLRLDYMQKLCSFMKAYKTNTIYYTDENRCIRVISGNNTAILMPSINTARTLEYYDYETEQLIEAGK